ncbi:MAG: transcription-repair coupling factor [Bacillota bacterium]
MGLRLDHGLLDQLTTLEELNNYCTRNLNTELSVNLSVSQRAFMTANLYERVSKQLLLITYSHQRALQLYEELLRLLSADEVFIFPQLEVLPHESIEVDLTVKTQRLTVLEQLSCSGTAVIIIPVQSLLTKLPPQKKFVNYSTNLDLTSKLDLQEFGRRLVAQGYQREEMIESQGEFSLRGGIIDIFPLTRDNPVRIELFGDEIESIREFDVATQRSIRELDTVKIPPATELLLNQTALNSGIDKIEADLEENYQRLLNQEQEVEANELKQRVNSQLEQLKEGIHFTGIRQYLPYFYDRLVTVIDYFSADGTLLLDAPNRLRKRAINQLEDYQDLQLSLLKQGSILSSYNHNFASWEELMTALTDYSKVYFNKTQQIKGFPLDRKLEIEIKEITTFHGQWERFLEQITKLSRGGYRLLITLSTTSKCQRMVDSLQNQGLTAFYSDQLKQEWQPGSIAVTVDSLREGFLLPQAKFGLFTEEDIFGETQRKKKRTLKSFDQGSQISSFADLRTGDYVVHENHGIGKYLGVKTLEVQGHHQDYLLIKYADDDKLYVPTDQVDLIQKYIGQEGSQPKLYSLNSNDWTRVKERVKDSVQEMAEDLLEIYAQREIKEGYAFSEDTIWQQEFEADFPYQETPDQLQAIKEVKADMESQQPMDRLLCGDVGYGKTEVAIRATFKAVMDGKQVAMLVPTTILAQQHLNTFVDRFADYPIKVAMLSRFKSAKEQEQIAQDLKAGLVDIIIGTHRLLSSDIQFNDLGLLIVDEEQRFGVKHKERLKQIKENIDVLTLTATPIPRTLHMSLVGVRDMSLIETPPKNRYPIRTYVREYNQDLIREAIRKEVDRGGQVYFVHNRVADIDKVAAQIKRLLPNINVAVAHGQMSEARLEKLMISFLAGDYDVLVCTTIIETGLDIPNVNTIIINRAEQLGLSQLYQLRGRVGRTNRVAYAYLLYQEDQVLSEVAEKRLQAIKEFTNLGSGFKIAMRDLEIRGAGNILGPKQHGHIEAIGFSLYCKLLEQAVEKAKNKGEEEEVLEVKIDLDVDAYLASDYISDSKQKIELYKKISSIDQLLEVEEIKDELRDRFGPIPDVVLNLIKIAKIKVLAAQLDITTIKSDGEKVLLYFATAEYLTGERIITLNNKYPDQIGFKSAEEPVLKIKAGTNDNKTLDDLIEIISFLSG